MTTTPTKDLATFTIHQLVRATGLSTDALARDLQTVTRADGEEGSIPACAFEALPETLRALIARKAGRAGLSVPDYLAAPEAQPWQPPVPWSELPRQQQLKAEKLQRVLLPLLTEADPNAGSRADSITRALPAPRAWQAGLAGFTGEFGYAISERHLRRLLHRAEQRDAGQADWQRVELYVDDSAYRKRKPAGNTLRRAAVQHQALAAAFDGVNRTEPTLEARQFIFDAAFRHYETLTGGLTDSPAHERRRRQVKRSLLQYLASAVPGLSKSAKALREQFNGKLREWRDGGCIPQALEDGRPGHSGRSAARLCPECRQQLKGGAVELDGDESQAWRRLHLQGRLCDRCATLWQFDVRAHKSYVPASVRAEVTPEVESALVWRHGPKAARLASPYSRRDWSDIGPGHAMEADDMTPNHVVHGVITSALAWQQDAAGCPYIGRLEILHAHDRRTDYPWGYVMILGEPADLFNGRQLKPHYSAVHIRLLFLRCHDSLGLPRPNGLAQLIRGEVWLENSVWKARLIDGAKRGQWEAIPWQRFEMGLRDPRIGLGIHHCLPGNARAKILERIFGAVQTRMRSAPGFLGFNERQDKREAMQDFVNRVKRGLEAPGNEVLHVDEFRRVLDAELMAFANEPQNGDRLPGVSPREAWLNGIGHWPGITDRPLRKLGDDTRHLLASHERLVKVSSERGITFDIGREKFLFWGPALERWQNRQLLVRHNLEEPQLLFCLPPEGEPFTLRARILPSSTATSEQMQQTARDWASWTRRGKIIYDDLPHPFRSTITRDNEQTEADKAFGRFHNAEVEQYRAEKSARSRKISRVRREAALSGIEITSEIRNPDRRLRGIEKLRNFQRLLAQEAALEPGEQA